MSNLFAGENSETIGGGGMPPRRINRYFVFNNSGEEVPAYAPMELSIQKTGSAGKFCWEIIKPSADNLQNVVFNEGHPLPNQKYGYGTLDYFNGGVMALYAGTAPVVGDSIGTSASAWTMKQGNTGFTALFADTTNKLCGVQPAGGGGGVGLQVVQVVADAAAGVVQVKQVVLGADLSASPNFSQSGDPFTVAYFSLRGGS